MAGTKQIRVGKVSRFVETLEIKLSVWKEGANALPQGHYVLGYIKCLEDTINDLKEEFTLGEGEEK